MDELTRGPDEATSKDCTYREPGIAGPTLYKWKAKYGGPEVSDLTRVEELEAELAQYKKMYAERSFNHQALKDVAAKGWQALPTSEKLRTCSPRQAAMSAALRCGEKRPATGRSIHRQTKVYLRTERAGT
jgi:putative transposase